MRSRRDQTNNFFEEFWNFFNFKKPWIYAGLQWQNAEGDKNEIFTLVKEHKKNKRCKANYLKNISKKSGENYLCFFENASRHELK